MKNDQLTAIRALLAAKQTTSVSGFVQHAVNVALLDATGWKEMLDEALQQTGGPLTKKERAWADSVLSPSHRQRGSRKKKAE